MNQTTYGAIPGATTPIEKALCVIEELNTQPALLELLHVLMASQHTHMSTLALQECGIVSPAAGVARLKEQGVIFETIYQSIVDRFGKARKRIACYKIVGGAAL